MGSTTIDSPTILLDVQARYVRVQLVQQASGIALAEVEIIEQSYFDETSKALTYDALGNTTSNGRHAFTYNQNNRLASATNLSTNEITTYVYNALGQRTSRKPEGKNETLYFYGLQGELLEEIDLNEGNVKSYLYFNSEPVAVVDDGDLYYVHTDHLATPKFLTDADQDIVRSLREL